MMYSIYFLKCPITKSVKWVGMTKDAVKRYYEHCRKDGGGNINKDIWINNLRNKGLKPLLEIVESGLNKYEAEEKEKYYISIYLGLYNIAEGGLKPPGQSGYKYSIEEKKKLFECSTLKKSVIQKTKDNIFVNEFKGVREACRQTGIDHRSIAEVANGSNSKRHTAGGFKWVYKN